SLQQSPNSSAIFKCVQVVSGAPTIIDIRTVLDEKDAKQHDAWDKLKWTIRVAERNPLRDDYSPTDDSNSTESTDRFFPALKNFQESNNIEGEVSYVNLDSSATSSSLTHQMAQFALQGGLEDDAKWSVNGNILDGPRASYSASGQYRQKIVQHHLNASFAA